MYYDEVVEQLGAFKRAPSKKGGKDISRVKKSLGW
jgi:hypothetical protein